MGHASRFLFGLVGMLRVRARHCAAASPGILKYWAVAIQAAVFLVFPILMAAIAIILGYRHDRLRALKVRIARMVNGGVPLILLIPSLLSAAISSNTVWEVRSSVGSDSNGGGFVAGATGTDMSQFNNKNAAACSSCQSSTANLSTTDAVANGTTTITSATAVFSAAIVGNIVEFSGGTGSITAVWKQVTAFTNATTITIDSSIAASTGMTMNIGGALATMGKAMAVVVTSNIIFVKATATYTITANITFPGGTNTTPSATTPPTQLIGYTTTRTDAGRATIQLSTNTGLKGIDGVNAGGWTVANFVVDCNSLGTSTGVSFGGGTSDALRNVLVKNCTTMGVSVNALNVAVLDSEITACSGTQAINLTGSGSSIVRSYIHDNTTTGITLQGVGTLAYSNVVANNSGASSDGIALNAGGPVYVLNNSIYNNGRNGLFGTSNPGIGQASVIRNNLLISNGASGLNGYVSGAGWGKFPQWDGNAYFGNTTAARTNADDTGTVNPVNAANPYTNTADVILTATPFTNTATHDFTLNSTAGGGAAAKGAGTPGTLPGLSQTGSMSFGALQPTTAAAVLVSASAFSQ